MSTDISVKLMWAYPVRLRKDALISPAMFDAWRMKAYWEWMDDGRPTLDGRTIRELIINA